MFVFIRVITVRAPMCMYKEGWLREHPCGYIEGVAKRAPMCMYIYKGDNRESTHVCLYKGDNREHPWVFNRRLVCFYIAGNFGTLASVWILCQYWWWWLRNQPSRIVLYRGTLWVHIWVRGGYIGSDDSMDCQLSVCTHSHTGPKQSFSCPPHMAPKGKRASRVRLRS